MTIKVRLFSKIKEMAGDSVYFLKFVQAITCGEAASQFAEQHLRDFGLLKQCALAKNGSFVSRDTVLSDGDELAILPPVSGG